MVVSPAHARHINYVWKFIQVIWHVNNISIEVLVIRWHEINKAHQQRYFVFAQAPSRIQTDRERASERVCYVIVCVCAISPCCNEIMIVQECWVLGGLWWIIPSSKYPSFYHLVWMIHCVHISNIWQWQCVVRANATKTHWQIAFLGVVYWSAM